jgi:hypothetical protein
MATNKTTLKNELRARYLKIISEALTAAGEEVLVTGSGEIACPCVDSEGEDAWCVLTAKIPTGSRDGEPYDGYAMAEDFKLKSEAKAAKAAEAAAKKAAKIAKDKAAREAKAKAKAEREEKEKEAE